MSITLYPGMTFTVECAFGYTLYDFGPVFTDITDYVMGVEIKRGRTNEFSQYSQGTASVQLNNSTRRFDPYFTTGPYYGNLKPMTPIRIRGNSVDVYYGFVTAWPSEYDISNKLSISTVPCVDAMRFFSNSYLNSSAFGKLVLGTASLMNFYPMQVVEPIGITCAKTNTVLALDSSGAGADYVSSNYPAGAAQMLAPGQSYSVPQSGWSNQQATSASPRSIEFWIDGRAQKNASSIINVIKQGTYAGLGSYNIDQFQVIISNTGVIGLVYSNISQNRIYGPFTTAINARPNVGANHVVVVTDATNIYIYVNGVQVYVAALSVGTGTGPYNNPQSITVSTGISNVAIYNAQLSAATILDRYTAGIGYPNELTSTRLNRLCDDIGWPAWKRLITLQAVQTVGSYRPTGQVASGYIRQIENAEQGAIFVNKSGDLQFNGRNQTQRSTIIDYFTDDGTSNYPYTNIEIDSNNLDKIFNTIVATYENGQTTQVNAASVTAYGPQVQQIDLNLMSTRADADAAAAVLLDRYQNPALTIQSLTINARSNSFYDSLVNNFELGQDYVVIFQPMDTGTVYWRAVKIEGINHSIRPQEWITTLYFSPGSTNVNGPLFILNSSTYGKLDSTSVLG